MKWKGKYSSEKVMNGGGAQGSLPGILEYLSQNNSCASFLADDERYKFIDDLSVLEIISLINIGFASFNAKQQVPSDMAVDLDFLPPSNIAFQSHLHRIEAWTEQNKMKLNTDKTNYMVVNFSKTHQFTTRFEIDGKVLQKVEQTRLLGVLIDSKLSWQANTTFLVQKAYKRMIMLHKLYSFAVPREDLVEIYILYIRSVLESSAVVWHSSLTLGQELELERVQKVALKIILKGEYQTYDDALLKCNLLTLSERRTQMCLVFAKKCVKTEQTKSMFPRNPTSHYNLRKPEKFLVTHAKSDRLKNSAIPFMQKLLNSNM